MLKEIQNLTSWLSNQNFKKEAAQVEFLIKKFARSQQDESNIMETLGIDLDTLWNIDNILSQQVRHEYNSRELAELALEAYLSQPETDGKLLDWAADVGLELPKPIDELRKAFSRTFMHDFSNNNIVESETAYLLLHNEDPKKYLSRIYNFFNESIENIFKFLKSKGMDPKTLSGEELAKYIYPPLDRLIDNPTFIGNFANWKNGDLDWRPKETLPEDYYA